MRDRWNERYAVKEFIYGKYPNEFLKYCLEKEIPGTILFPSEGEGRNAVYAAKQGWKVHAVDYSEIAKQKALNWAQTNKVSIVYQLADISDWNSTANYDVVALIFAHYPPEQRRFIHRKLISYLKPGGKLILESFSKKQIDYTSGGPANQSLLYDIPTLQNDFNAMKIHYLEECKILLNEGNYHQGEACVIRMIAEKQ